MTGVLPAPPAPPHRGTHVIIADEDAQCLWGFWPWHSRPATATPGHPDRSSIDSPHAGVTVFRGTCGGLGLTRDAGGRITAVRLPQAGVQQQQHPEAPQARCIVLLRGTRRWGPPAPLVAQGIACEESPVPAAFWTHLVDTRMAALQAHTYAPQWAAVQAELFGAAPATPPPPEAPSPAYGSPKCVSTFWVLWCRKKVLGTRSALRSGRWERAAAAAFSWAVDAALGVAAALAIAAAYRGWQAQQQHCSALAAAFPLSAFLSGVVLRPLLALQHNGHSYVGWLLGWPAGFKGNAFLNQLLGEGMAGLLHAGDALGSAAAALPLLEQRAGGAGVWWWWWWVAACGALGASGMACLAADCAKLLTLNVRVALLLCGTLYAGLHAVVVDLSRLLRGSKFNTLRNKVDSHTFDQHQKLLGALIFSLAVFLLPTVAVYFIFFALWHTSIAAAVDAVHLVVSLHLSLPYLALCLYPLRPASASLRLIHCGSVQCEVPGSPPAPAAAFRLQQNPMRLAVLLQHCRRALQEWAADNPAKSLRRLLATGHGS